MNFWFYFLVFILEDKVRGYNLNIFKWIGIEKFWLVFIYLEELFYKFYEERKR